ncbi:hypothetical protein RB595_004353 [Gaeumannomyces hyphopodioides]
MASQYLDPTSQHTRRKRAPHKRTRNGCAECKKKHVRCSLEKPVCTSCLVRGTECQYPEGSAAVSTVSGHLTVSRSPTRATSSPVSPGSPAPSTSNLAGTPSPWLLPAALPVDPFNSIPVDMPFRSYEMLQHHIDYRHLASSVIPFFQSPVQIFNGSQDSLKVHSIITCACVHISWLGGSIKPVEETYLYHKIEKMRILQQLIDEGRPELCLTSVASTLRLALSDTAMGEDEAGAAHMRGLFGLVQAQGKTVPPMVPRMMLVIASLIAAARDAAKAGPNSNEIFGIVPATPIFVVQGDDPTNMIPNYFGIAVPSSPASGCDGGITSSSSSPTHPIPAAAWITAAYLLMHVIHELNWGTWVVEPRLVAWLLGSPPLSPPPTPTPAESWMQFWLWRTVIGAYVFLGGAAIPPPLPGASGPDCSSGGSSGSIAEVQGWFDPLVERWMGRSATAGLAQWDVAQELVAKLAWLGTAGAGERFLAETWREAARLRDGEQEAARMAAREQATALGGLLDGLQSFAMGPDDAPPAPATGAGGHVDGGYGDIWGS